MPRLSEKGTEFMFAQPKVHMVQDVEHILCLQVQGNLELNENDIVGQLGFWLRLRSVLPSSFFNNEPV